MMIRLLLSSILLASACGKAASGPGRTANSPTAETDRTASDMRQHFERVAALERAVIDDRMDDVRKQATAIIEARTGDPDEWAPYVGYLRRAAESVLRAPDMTQAAIATATVVGQCGRCHTALDVALSKDKVDDVPPDATLAEQMRRHQWATDALRTAIVFSSDELWLRGAEVLAVSPLDASELDDDTPLDPKIEAHIRDLRQLAAIALAAPADERQGTYGAILRTCANCHITAR